MEDDLDIAEFQFNMTDDEISDFIDALHILPSVVLFLALLMVVYKADRRMDQLL